MTDYFPLIISLAFTIPFIIFICFIRPLLEKKKLEKIQSNLLRKKRQFAVKRMAAGRGYSGTGSFPQLVCILKSALPKIIIGHPQSKRFAIGSFFFMPTHEVIDVGTEKILVGSDDKDTLSKIKTDLVSKPELAKDIALIFNREFSHFTIASEWHVGFYGLKKNYVFRYTCLPESIYNDPATLESYLVSLEKILDLMEEKSLEAI